jgi:ABC-type glycerol-3-phosphate transport system substrate-binding protein
MSHMRPFQIIVISLFAVLALGGLALFASFKGFSGGKPVGSVTIWGTLPTGAVQAALDDLRRTHTEFSGIIYQEHNAASFDAELSEALASGNGPDIVITNQERLLAEAGKLAVIPFATISERTYRDTYLPINEIFLTSTGTYVIPLAVDPLVLYYNRPTLSAANVPQVPTTWEGVVGLASRLTRKSDAGVISKSAIPFGTYENIPNARAIVSLLFLQSGSAVSARTSGGLRSTLQGAGETTNDGSSPAESAMNFYTQFADPAKIVYSWNRSLTDARHAFIAGDAAFYVGFASERGLIAAANPNLDFDIAPIPQPQTAAGRANYAIAYGFAITKASRNPSGAFRTASALASQTEAPFIYKSLGMAPAIRSLLSAPANDISAPIVYPSALIAKGWLSPAPGITDRIFAGMINSIINGSMSVHDALTTADESLTAALSST